jgi:hypothetical protein
MPRQRNKNLQGNPSIIINDSSKELVTEKSTSRLIGKPQHDAIQRINRRTNADQNNKEEELGQVISQNQFIGNDNADVSTSAESPKSPKSPNSSTNLPANPGEITLTETQLKQMLDTAILKVQSDSKNTINQYEQRLRELGDSLIASQREFREKEENLLKQVEYEKQQKDTVARIFNDFGYAPSPADNNNVYIAPLSMRGGGMDGKTAYREFNTLCEDNKLLQTRSIVVPSTGERVLHQDVTPLQRFIVQNRDAIRNGMEDMARKVGLLNGSDNYRGSDAPTTFSTLPFALQTYLSTVVRAEHTPQFVLWQFVNRTVSVGIPPGQTTSVPRVFNLPTGTSSSDWERTVGVKTVVDRQALTGSDQKIVIKLNGMGKNSAMPPVSIPEFITLNSLLRLENLLQEKLGINYYEFEDLAIYEMLASTTAVVYNNKDSVVFAPGSVTNGGQSTLGFLSDLNAYASSLNIRRYPDGCRVYVCPDQHIAQIDKSMQNRAFYQNRTNVEELTNMLNKSTNNPDLFRVSGYWGTMSGLHIFSQSNFGNGTVGSRGVQTETLGGTSVTTRSGYLLGADTMGWSTSMPMQVRQDAGGTDFNLSQDFIWVSHEGWGPLDVDPNSNPPSSAGQQLRVIEVRMSDTTIG